MKWFALLACLMLATPALARPDTPKDESNPKLVRMYIGFPCEALDLSYTFQSSELEHLSNHLNDCYELAEKHSDFKYGKLMCMYIKLQWNGMHTHSKSVEKAYDIMCDDGGQRKEPEYEIHF